jgi:hypothetical protein
MKEIFSNLLAPNNLFPTNQFPGYSFLFVYMILFYQVSIN